MAAPNIVNVTSILGENSSTSLTSTSATSIVSNAASSGKVLKINTLIVSNVDGTNACDITINKYSAAALGGSAFAIASTVSVPADASLIVVDKTTSIYLKENESIGATAGTANDLIVTCSWEDIS
jgi:hypothetical protein